MNYLREGNLKSLKYTNNVIKEVLRLYPAASFLSRTIDTDDVSIKYNNRNIKIPKGTIVSAPTTVLAKKEENWGENAKVIFLQIRFVFSSNKYCVCKPVFKLINEELRIPVFLDECCEKDISFI